MIFAEFAAPTSTQLTDFIVPLAALGAMVLIFLKIIEHFQKKGIVQPLVVAPQASYADKAETDRRFKHVESKIEAARIENKDEMEKSRVEAIEGRRLLHKDIAHVVERIGDKLGDFSLEITNSVGELRGEVRRISNK
jgi:hypothetical protein